MTETEKTIATAMRINIGSATAVQAKQSQESLKVVADWNGNRADYLLDQAKRDGRFGAIAMVAGIALLGGSIASDIVFKLAKNFQILLFPAVAGIIAFTLGSSRISNVLSYKLGAKEHNVERQALLAKMKDVQSEDELGQECALVANALAENVKFFVPKMETSIDNAFINFSPRVRLQLMVDQGNSLLGLIDAGFKPASPKP